MGRQVTVDLVPLMKAGCRIRIQDNNPDQSWLVVKLPDGRVMNSDADGVLSFDCRSIEHSSNGWMERWLIDNKVPYAHG